MAESAEGTKSTELAGEAVSITDAKIEKVIDVDSEKKHVSFGCCKLEERKYVLGLFTLINIFLFADQNLLAPNLTVISEEFNMTEDERDIYLGGYISIGFFAVGGVVAVVVG